MQTCDSCGEKRRSEEWSLSAELAKSNRRVFIILMVVIFLWFATIIGFIWYINQFDYVTEVQTETNDLEAYQDGGGVNIAGNGDIRYGAESKDQNDQN